MIVTQFCSFSLILNFSPFVIARNNPVIQFGPIKHYKKLAESRLWVLVLSYTEGVVREANLQYFSFSSYFNQGIAAILLPGGNTNEYGRPGAKNGKA